MTIEIILNQIDSQLIDHGFLECAIRLTLEKHDNPDVDITLTLTNNEAVRQLNMTYRGLDKPTDVLAFNQEFNNPETGRLYLGDVIISFEQAKIQAKEHNHTLNEECALLTIHGILHLLGFDHSDQNEKDEMWALQEDIMNALRLSREEPSK